MTLDLKSEWQPPKLSELPHKLDGLIGYDLETNDEGIRAGQGAGWAWGGGHVVGVSVTADNFSGYLPFAHEGGGNLDPEAVISIVNRWMSNPHQACVGANVLYDLGWSKRAGIDVKCRCYDVQWAEALLDEHKWSYSLDALAKAYLNEGKDETLLREAAAQFGVDPKGGLWRLPSMFVGPYATADSEKTRRVFLAQVPKLKEKGLWDLFQLECDLLPLYLDMRWRGVRVDMDQVSRLKIRFEKDAKDAVAEIKAKTGVEVSLWAAESLSRALDAEQIKYPRTPKTDKPSVTQEWLKEQDHWLPKLILNGRIASKLAGTFIDGAILSNIHNGRIHTEFHPLREIPEDGEGKGTISGRLSSSNPNLQQVPKRTEAGLLLRTCFLPEEGQKWFSLDYSQQEPRLTVHYAAITTLDGSPLAGAAEAVAKYKIDPKMSYHKMVAAETGLPYDTAKILNLALTYGRGAASTARVLGLSLEEAEKYIETYHQRLPFVKALDLVLKNRVNERGEFKTLLGRVCRFPLWEIAPVWEDGKIVNEKEYKTQAPQPLWKAQQLWPGKRLQRAHLHKKLNRLIQGSAADQTKKAMLDIWKAGLGKYMLIQIHDELCFSFPDPAMAAQAAKIMEDAVQLKVPVIAEVKHGANWGEVK